MLLMYLSSRRLYKQKCKYIHKQKTSGLMDLSYYINKAKLGGGDVSSMPAEIKAEILNRTAKCTGVMGERIYWLKNKLDSYPLCKHCGLSLTSKSFLNGQLGYRRFCGKKCSTNSEDSKLANEKTFAERYGGLNPMATKEVQEKRQQTNFLKYGNKNPGSWESPLFKERMKTKYGVEHALQVQAVREKVSSSLRQSFITTGKLETRLIEIKETEGVTLEGEYCGYDVPMKWKHTCGTSFMSNLADGKIPSCPSCYAKSRPEYELFKAIEERVGFGKAIRNDRTLIKPLELDVYLPELNLAFEMNGLYYHSDLFLGSKAKNYHREKQALCKAKNVQLIHIFEDEWETKRAIILNKIDSLLGLTERIYARKLQVHQVPYPIKKEFLQRHHLQGDDVCKVAYALTDDIGNVKALMTFAKARFSKTHTWELSRFTNESGITVVGAASRLLNAFVKEYKPQSLVTYADARFSTGLFYETLGFKFIGLSSPNYWYIKGERKLSRYQTQKHKLKSLLNNFDPKLSEAANMAAAGWSKIYDCGNYVYELKT